MKIFKQMLPDSSILPVFKDIVVSYLEYIIEAGKCTAVYLAPDRFVSSFRDVLCGENYLAGYDAKYGNTHAWGAKDVKDIFDWFDGLSDADKEVAVKGIQWALGESGDYVCSREPRFTSGKAAAAHAKDLCCAFLKKVSYIRGYTSDDFLLRKPKDSTFFITILADAYGLRQLESWEIEYGDNPELLAEIDRQIAKDD